MTTLIAACCLVSSVAMWTPVVSGDPLPATKSPHHAIPVAKAKDGLPAHLTYLMRRDFNSTNAYYTGDQNLYTLLHWEEFIPHNLVRRAGPVSELEVEPHDEIGNVSAETSLGQMSLDTLIDDVRSRIQGYVVIKDGKILYEKYPGMRETDHHLWFSTSKTLAGLLVGLLEEDGLIDVDRPIEYYMPELGATFWSGVPVIDILDMASGLDLVESEQTRTSLTHSVGKFFRIELGDTSNLGQRTSDQILMAVGEKRPSGEVFEYSSLNTKMLGWLAERVSGQRVADLLSERIWSKMGAEGDGQVGVNLQGGAAIYGMMSSRLRDKARYGMLYTPSWRVVSGERVVPQSLLNRIQEDCRPHLYERSGRGPGPDGERKCNSRQWDIVFTDGDMYKGGARGQGLYVSPGKNVVVAWFSTTSESGWMNYAREIAVELGEN